ncbi:hypothetical protein Bca52824_072025 [Brassica carinata]|uniref:Uncharacterized protein n=1 Tax=Brassica carinata TaxID=52824 RepID=A0A8X7U5D6_BRACI|nr:hypothetical protein Bca52824_072025 [Brassica carinata]
MSPISTDGGISWTIGYVFSVLESLPIESMNTFWWEGNKVLMNDEDIRDATQVEVVMYDLIVLPMVLMDLLVMNPVVEGLWEEVLMVEDLLEIMDFH